MIPWVWCSRCGAVGADECIPNCGNIFRDTLCCTLVMIDVSCDLGATDGCYHFVMLTHNELAVHRYM